MVKNEKIHESQKKRLTMVQELYYNMGVNKGGLKNVIKLFT